MVAVIEVAFENMQFNKLYQLNGGGSGMKARNKDALPCFWLTAPRAFRLPLQLLFLVAGQHRLV